MSKRRIGNLKGIDIVEGDINIVNDSEVHISKLFELYAKDYTFCWLIMTIDTRELIESQPTGRPKLEDLSFIIVDLLKEQYIFSNVPKDIKTMPIEFKDGYVKLNVSPTLDGFIISNKCITMVDTGGSQFPWGNLISLYASNGQIIVDNKSIRFA